MFQSFLFGHFLKYDIKNKWYLKYENDKYADIGKIAKHFDTDISAALPAFHGLTGCDTTSYFFRIGKVRVFKKLMKKCSKLELLDSLRRKEELDEDDFADIKEFIRTVLYSGNPTRITLVLEYEFMKI